MKYYYQIEGDLRNNIGDVLQGMAAKAFLPSEATVADREALGDLDDSEPSFLLANGWYMHSYDKFPPPLNVKPLYISVHVAQAQLLASPKVRDHFNDFSPIGCRDSKTLKLFLGWGIPAYYSGCLTTTITPRSLINHSGKGEVLLVDNIDHPVPENVRVKLENLLNTSLIRISHDPPNTDGDLESYSKKSESHMNYLLERYCKASLIITTKIHCALPCLGMGANIMVIHPNPNDPRLDTVREFINIISYEEILKIDRIRPPQVKKFALMKRKKFLSYIVNESINNGFNILQNPNSVKLKLIKAKSICMAKLFRFGIITTFKIGLASNQVKKVYGISVKAT